MYISVLRLRPKAIVGIVPVLAALASQRCERKEIDDGNWDGNSSHSAGQRFFTSKHAVTLCENASDPPQSSFRDKPGAAPHGASWIRRNILAPIGISLPKPRLLTSKDPALKVPSKCIRQRKRDEVKMRELLEKAPVLRGDPERMKVLSEELFEVTYGKGVTAQEREDFLIRYGCTGWNEHVIKTILQVAGSRGIVEMGAGHGQWARTLSEAYAELAEGPKGDPKKRFDFVLAYDDNSNLPLNTHIYNAYTQPHHDFFGNVHKLETKNDMLRVLRSFACRGRVLLLVYPPPGDMATQVVTAYVNAAPEDNDTVIYVGEGRGGANGDDSLFDYFERGDWELVEELDVHRPPGDKGYEKLFILRRHSEFNVGI